MAFDWVEYLNLAKDLADHKGNEAALRSAISRAYYAAFCKARNRLLREGERIPRTGQAHELVWNTYRGASDSIQNNIGIVGDRLYRNRAIADYEDKFPNLSNTVELSLSNANNVLRQLAELDH